MGLIRQLIDIQYEKMQIHRAMRILKDQEWSLEFLMGLLNKAMQYKKQNVQMTLKNKNGQELVIRADIPMTQDLAKKDQQLDVLAGNITLEDVLDQAEIQGIL